MKNIPYKIAVLCYLYDTNDRLLLLHRKKDPNKGMYSPIGGKLEVGEGEGPHECARRETNEETGIDLDPEVIRLCGVISEKAYEGQTHWLIFLYEITRPIQPEEIVQMEMDEGHLEWVAVDEVHDIGIPHTDREILWPLIQKHRGGFFQVHIDCSQEPIDWTVHEAWTPPRIPGYP